MLQLAPSTPTVGVDEEQRKCDDIALPVDLQVRGGSYCRCLDLLAGSCIGAGDAGLEI
jgi:hypothetical protein